MLSTKNLNQLLSLVRDLCHQLWEKPLSKLKLKTLVYVFLYGISPLTNLIGASVSLDFSGACEAPDVFGACVSLDVLGAGA